MTMTADREAPPQIKARSRPSLPVAIVGAGPYGLALAAHLHEAQVPVRIFGQPMSYWQQNMPAGMFLRSSWEASHIGQREGRLTLDAYQDVIGQQLGRPIPLDDFVGYGLWYAEEMGESIDQRRVTSIQSRGSGFALTLEDGDVCDASRVIVATGLAGFQRIPELFRGMSPSVVRHASEVRDLSEFEDKRVVVVGLGQSAVETAVLASEAGASVEIVGRGPQIRWLKRSASLHHRAKPIRSLLYPPTDVGPPILNQIVARPNLWRTFPRESRARIAYRSIRPAAASWLTDRSEKLMVTVDRSIISVDDAPIGIRLRLDNHTTRHVDQVLLATGYRIHVDRYTFLHLDLLKALKTVDGYPVLTRGFESSIPGLHFVGASSAMSFGPVMRFVSGTPFTARSVTRALRKTAAL